MTPQTRGWTCPACDRSFKNTNQSHSCTTGSVGRLLDGKPDAVAAAYTTVAQYLKSLGDVTVEPLKTRVSFKDGATFASLQVRKNHVIVSFALTEDPQDERITAGDVYGGKRIYWFTVADAKGLDARLKRVLKTAWRDR